MASATIHLAVAKKVNEELRLEEKPFYLGAIAPDIAKHVGESRDISHFVKVGTNIPDIKLFLSKYKQYLNNPYELGYFVHLLTDEIWFSEFLPNFVQGNHIVNKYGEKIYMEENNIDKIIYNDYSNLNEQVVNYYNLDYSLFYEPFDYPENHIEEVKSEHFDELMVKFSEFTTIMSNYNFLIEIEPITHFVEYVTKYCLDCIRGLNE